MMSTHRSRLDLLRVFSPVHHFHSLPHSGANPQMIDHVRGVNSASNKAIQENSWWNTSSPHTLGMRRLTRATAGPERQVRAKSKRFTRRCSRRDLILGLAPVVTSCFGSGQWLSDNRFVGLTMRQEPPGRAISLILLAPATMMHWVKRRKIRYSYPCCHPI